MKNKRSLVVGAAIAAVAALVVAGLLAVGSPATARKFKADQRRIEQLSELHRMLVNHFIDEGELPATLEALNPTLFEGYGLSIDPRRDPETGVLFEFSKLADREYEVCARFHTSSGDPRNPNQAFRGFRPPPEAALLGYLEYQPGRNCFKRMLTNSEIRDFYPPRPPIPGAAIVPEVAVSPVLPSIQGGTSPGTSILVP